MDKEIKSPSKEEVREYMQRRFAEKKPLPSLQQIRRELGWELVAPTDRGRDDDMPLMVNTPAF